MTDLRGKVVVVTGAAMGIGRSMALALASRGANVALLDIDAGALQAGLAGFDACEADAFPWQTDVSDKSSVTAAISAVIGRFGHIDGIINNAAIARYEEIVLVEERVIDSTFNVGLKGIFWTTQAALPSLAERSGAIVNICSGAAIVGIPRSSVYSAMKGAVLSLTRQLAAELGASGIRVNAISPGSTRTSMTEGLLDDAAWEQRRRRTPLNVASSPEDLAGLAVFLMSDEARRITGQHILADGGMSGSLL